MNYQDFVKKLSNYFSTIHDNIEFLDYDERSELLNFLNYYLDKIFIRKFEHNFKLDK